MPPLNKKLVEALAGASDLLNANISDDWLHEPVTLDVFLKDHLQLEPLTTRQFHDINMFLGKDPKKVLSKTFDNLGSPFNLFVWLGGKGSGKDYVGSIVVTYLFYLLLCMRDPQAYFGFPAGEAIDMLIISYSADQALYISFDKIKQRIKHWNWLRTNYSVILGEKFISGKGKPEIRIHNDMILSHNNVRIIAEHSQNESYEGYNPLMFVMSESSAFVSTTKTRNGDKVFDTLRSSCASRFGNRYKGMIMSFPRYDEQSDFTYQLYQRGVKDGVIEDKHDPTKSTRIWASKGAPWEYKPAKYFSGKWTKFEGTRIPLELLEEFEKRPAESRRMYLCEPGIGALTKATPEILIKSTHQQPPLFAFSPYIHNRQVCVDLVGFPDKSVFRDRCILSVDLGHSHASTAASLHYYSQQQKACIMMAIGEWCPQQDPVTKEVYPVDLLDVKKNILKIAQQIPHVVVGFDQWQSLLYVAELKAVGIEAIQYHTYERDYGLYMTALASGLVKILDYAPLHTQLKALKFENENVTLDTKISERKDLVDSSIGGLKMLMENYRPTLLDGEIIGNNLTEFGTLVWG